MARNARYRYRISFAFDQLIDRSIDTSHSMEMQHTFEFNSRDDSFNISLPFLCLRVFECVRSAFES